MNKPVGPFALVCMLSAKNASKNVLSSSGMKDLMSEERDNQTNKYLYIEREECDSNNIGSKDQGVVKRNNNVNDMKWRQSLKFFDT